MLRSIVITSAKRAIRQESRTLCTLRNEWSVNLQQRSTNSDTLLLRHRNSGLSTFKRLKHQNQKHGKGASAAQDEDSSSSEDEDSTSSEDENTDETDDSSSDEEEDISTLIAEGLPHYMATKDAIYSKVVVPSPRLDIVAKAVFATSRKNIESQFYNSKLRLNAQVESKKSVLVNKGDEIDLIIGFDHNNPEMLRVRRAYITDVKPVNKGAGVNAVVQRNLLIENYSTPWEPEG